MNAEWIIIDGNNLLHQAPREMVGNVETDFVSARQRLARRLDELAGQVANRVTIIFDGTRAGRDEHFDSSSVEVIFCGREDTADAMIERLAGASRHPDTILVVTSDRAERETVEARGVRSMSCAHFLEHISNIHLELAQKLNVRKTMARKTTLGDFFP